MISLLKIRYKLMLKIKFLSAYNLELYKLFLIFISRKSYEFLFSDNHRNSTPFPMEKEKYIFNTQHIQSHSKLISTRAYQLNAKDNEVLDNMVNYSRKTRNYLNLGPFEI